MHETVCKSENHQEKKYITLVDNLIFHTVFHSYAFHVIQKIYMI